MRTKLTLVLLSFCLQVSCGISSFRTADDELDASRSDKEDLLVGEADAIAEEAGTIKEEIATVINQSIVSVVEEKADSSMELKLCSDGQVKEKTERLLFPKRKHCSFGAGDNLKPRSGYMQAREIDSILVELEEKTIICDMALISRSKELHYDDYMFFTLNDTILIASETGWADYFPTGENGLKTWNWNLLKGQAHAGVEASDQYGLQYCLGDANCLVPKHDEKGAFRYQISFVEGQEALFMEINKTRSLNFNLIATGDNNKGDCFHSDFDLDLNIKYAIAP